MTAPAQGDSPAKGMPKALRNKKVLIVGGVVGGVIVFVAFRRAKAANAQTVAAGDVASEDLYAQGGGDYGTAGMGNAGGSIYSRLSGLTFNPATGKYEDPNATKSDQDYETVTVTDNQSWAKKALLYLQSLGFDRAAGAQSVGKYLSGVELTPQDENMIATIMGGIGSTPVAVPSSTNQSQTFAQWARSHVLNPDDTVRYTQDTSTGAVYQVWGSGESIWLDPATWRTLVETKGASIGSKFEGNGQLRPDFDLFEETTADNPVVVKNGDWQNVPSAN